MKRTLQWAMFLAVALVGFELPVCCATNTPTEARAAAIAVQDTTAYTLPPEKLARAEALQRTEMTLNIAGEVWMVLLLVLLLASGRVAAMRDWSARLSSRRWAQGLCFAFLLLLAAWLLNLPLGVYGHHVALRYALSVQGWGSWLADRAKMLALVWALAAVPVVLLARLIRRSPRRWWFWAWLPAAALMVVGVLIAPYAIDPIFHTFEPLGKANPVLVEQLERVVARSGMKIPPERMFLMKASAKSTTLNAYVTGFGPSKRVVVWDTTAAKATPDEIAFIFAHELGHYALGHVALGVALSCLGLLPLLWLGYLGTGVLLARYGAAWRIPSQRDWGALAVLALVMLTVSDISAPLGNAVSRWMEHNADVYGQEAVHGIVADPGSTGQRSFQLLGEDSLDDPTPHPLYQWWFGTHPSIAFRAAFARAYDPWGPGERPKYFPRGRRKH